MTEEINVTFESTDHSEEIADKSNNVNEDAINTENSIINKKCGPEMHGNSQNNAVTDVEMVTLDAGNNFTVNDPTKGTSDDFHAESNTKQQESSTLDSDSGNENNVAKKNHKRLVLHSDSDEDPDELDKVNSPPQVAKSRLSALCDPDSSDELDTLDAGNNVTVIDPMKETSDGHLHTETNTKQQESSTLDSDLDNEKNVVKKKHKRLVLNSDSDDDPGELDTENSPPQVAKSRLTALCDSDSSDDDGSIREEPPKQVDSDKDDEQDEDTIKPVIYKRKSANKENREPKKMTGKEAAEQRKEIQSESQRRLRESNVSLPYHKPKSHSLKEFLARRSKFNSGLPFKSKLPPSVAIKMSREQLEIVSKKIKEREKEVKEFYKSESEEESDDGEDVDYVPDEGKEAEGEKQLDVEEQKEALQESMVEEHKEQTVHKEATLEEKEPNLEELHETHVEEQMDTSTKEPDTEKPETTDVEMQEDVQNAKRNLFGDDTRPDEIIGAQDGTPEESIMRNTESPSCSKERNSMDFEFNLDDVEDSEVLLKDAKEQTAKDIDKYDITDLIEEPPKKTFKELLREKLGDTAPKLIGTSEEVIDLDSGVIKPDEVTKLMKRFVQHTAKKHMHKNKAKVHVISVSGGEIHKETVAVNVDDEDSLTNEEKPGAKLQKLRDKLQNEMAQKRSELWQQKATKTITVSGKPDGDDKEDYEEGWDDPLLDNEDEEDFTESETEDEEDVPEDAPRKKSQFVDDEADEESADDVSDKEENNVESDASQQSKYSDVYEKIDDILPQKKSRIIKGFTEDSDDDDDDERRENTTVKLNDDTLSSTLSLNEDAPPAHQKEQSKTPQKSIIRDKSEFEFLTPITFMTGLQNLNSTSKLKDSPAPEAPYLISSEISPFKSTQKQLFADESQDMTSQEKNELANMCTGNFLTPSETESDNLDDLAAMCTGQFSSKDDPSATQGEAARPSIILDANPAKEVKNLDEDQDQIISQLLDEEEMEQFKKKFESPAVAEVSGTGGVIDSEDEGDETIAVKRRKQKKLVFSDDEVSDDEQSDGSEKIDLHDEDDEDDEHRQIDYDSEENEIEIVNDDGGGGERPVYKASEFFDKEAELSESEWGSADEDEVDLDVLEFEKGDKEKFDENKLRTDIEKIHMRQILDEDNRDIKFLQELLLEDGELHGTGRERQFKWKNINSIDGEDDDKKTEEDEVYLDEDESEEQWRKKRHEREMFLKEQLAKKSMDSDEDEDLANDSQILKLGQKVIQTQTITLETTKSQTTVSSQPFSMLSKRGSFLTRSEQVLQRLAESNKLTTSVVGAATAKNSRNFVFQSVSQVETKVTVLQDKKRKAADGTPNVLKKIRLSSNFSPMVGKKKSERPDRAKKLFAGSQ